MRVQDECKSFVGQYLCSSCLKPLQLCSKNIVIARQSHRFYAPIALLLKSGKNDDEKGFNRREKRVGYIEAVEGLDCGGIKAVTCEIIEQKKLPNDLRSLESNMFI